MAREFDSNQVEVDLYLHLDRDPALGHQVLAHLEARAAELAGMAGHAQPWMGTGAYRQDERARSWLAAAGWTVGTTFTRMRIDLDDATNLGAPDPRISLHRVALDDEARLRTAHRISQESFAEHYGHLDQPWDTWRKRLTERGADFAEVVLASLAEDREAGPVGVLVGTRQFEPDLDAGYVRTLGALPEGRGRGVAKALLRDYFAVLEIDAWAKGIREPS